MRQGTSNSGSAWESALGPRLSPEYVPDVRDRGLDFLNERTGHCIELKLGSGARDLHAAMFQVALSLAQHPGTTATLVIHLTRMAAARAREEWRLLGGVLSPAIFGRLSLIAFGTDGVAVLPSDEPPALRRLRALAEATRPAEERPESGSGIWSPKQFEVWKVLLAAFLRNEPPLPLVEIERRSGAKYEAVAATVDRLFSLGELTRTSSRSVGFNGMPRRSLADALTVAETFRGTLRFVDGTGRAPTPESIAQRLEKKAPPGVSFGGVLAARHYFPAFDLAGLPRLDLLANRPFGADDLERLLPGLAPHRRDGPPPLVVLHRVRTPALPVEHGDRPLPFAHPVDTLLDLYDLRLDAQAAEFARALRRQTTP